jgi:hypothetical protein
MASLIQTIFRDVSPFLLARDLQLKLHASQKLHFIEHDQLPGTRLWLYQKGFVADTRNSQFQAGDIFDFLAFHLGSYDDAVAFMMTQYRNLADTALLSHIEHNLGGCAVELEEQHRLQEHLANMSLTWNNSSAGMAWLTRFELPVRLAENLLLLATGSDIKNLLSDYSTQLRGLRDTTEYVGYPYYNKFHSISNVVWSPITGGYPVTVTLDETQVSFFGLSTVRLEGRDVRVFGSPEDALTHYARQYSLGNHDLGIVSPRFGDGVGSSSIRLPCGTYVAKDDQDVVQPARLRHVFHDFKVVMASDIDLSPELPASYDWNTFVLHAFSHQFQAVPDVSAARHILDACRYDNETRTLLVDWMQAQPVTAELTEVLNHAMTSESYVIGDIHVEETAGGYVYRSNKSERSKLTNFVIRLHSSIWFQGKGDANDTYDYGVMHMGKAEVPFRVNHADLDNAQALISILRAAVKHCSDGTSNLQPEIYALSNKTKHLMGCVLREQLQRFVPSTRGSKHLGWNETRTLFDTPAWRTSADGLDSTGQPLYPASLVLTRNFSPTPVNLSESVAAVPAPALRYVAILASMLARLYTKRPVQTVCLKHTSHSQDLCQALFRAFGQVGPVELNLNERREISMLSNDLTDLPVYGTSDLTRDVDPGSRSAVFALSAHGLQIECELDHQAQQRLTTLMVKIAQQLTIWLQRNTSDCVDLLCKHPQASDDYVAEGKALILAGTEFDQFDTEISSWCNIETMVACADHKAYGELVSYDHRRKSAVFQFVQSNVPGMSLSTLVAELCRLAPDAKLVSSSKNSASVAVPIHDALKIVRRFRGPNAEILPSSISGQRGRLRVYAG